MCSSHYLTLPAHPPESVFDVTAEAALAALPSHELFVDLRWHLS